MAVGQGSRFPLPPVAGVCLSAVASGIRVGGAPDLVLIELAVGSTAAAVFTRNAFCAAPVTVAREHLQVDPGAIRYLLINAGNANAGTGAEGLSACRLSCEALAAHAGVAASQVLPFSTGVIGEPLPVDRLVAALPAALLELTTDGWDAAASGIMTTDTRPKGASRTVNLDGRKVTVSGIAKGAGMIRPDMATMLAYLGTDAAVSPEVLGQILDEAMGESFNSITVDGDTSTNDACVLFASGASGLRIASARDAAGTALCQAVRDVAVELAQAIIRDAEGASKFVAVQVREARDRQEARRVAYTVAESPLVKTALFASDPNWGRILAAVGRAGVDELDLGGVDIDLGEVRIVAGGARDENYSEARGQVVMDRDEIDIHVSLGRGDAAATVWTSDLSHDYVRINAEYRS